MLSAVVCFCCAVQYNCVHPKTSIYDAMEEAKMVTCGAIEGLLKKQGALQDTCCCQHSCN